MPDRRDKYHLSLSSHSPGGKMWEVFLSAIFCTGYGTFLSPLSNPGPGEGGSSRKDLRRAPHLMIGVDDPLMVHSCILHQHHPTQRPDAPQSLVELARFSRVHTRIRATCTHLL